MTVEGQKLAPALETHSGQCVELRWPSGQILHLFQRCVGDAQVRDGVQALVQEW